MTTLLFGHMEQIRPSKGVIEGDTQDMEQYLILTLHSTSHSLCF